MSPSLERAPISRLPCPASIPASPSWRAPGVCGGDRPQLLLHNSARPFHQRTRCCFTPLRRYHQRQAIEGSSGIEVSGATGGFEDRQRPLVSLKRARVIPLRL